MNHLREVPLSEELQAFILSVNQAYINQDKDRVLLERSIDISSREYNENMEKIRMLQGQLVQQEKLAGIGQLSAGIAHEINNPLGYTQSNLDTLRKYLARIKSLLHLLNDVDKVLATETAAEMKSLLENIREIQKKNKINRIADDLDDIIEESITGLSRIEKIVKSLLGFARSSSSEFEDYDLNKGIIDTLAVANNEIKYFARVVEELGDIPYIKAAGGSINQVLLNLIVNAVYAIKESTNEGIITIKTFEGNNSVYCSIKDTGTGIAKENLNEVFTPFFTTKPVGKGTGLGLSIAYDIIVNKHGGEIKIESEEGKGTTFMLRLPIEHVVAVTV